MMGQVRLKGLVSGGQTGADRAALDWAMENRVAHGGWCPKGRRAEDGPLPRRYRLKQTASTAYPQRTERNIQDSDGTVIISIRAKLTGGSLLTKKFAHMLGKPLLHLHRRSRQPEKRLRDFVRKHKIQVLNVAGPRDSEEPEVAHFVRDVLNKAFSSEFRL